jgi:hypothetical protein
MSGNRIRAYENLWTAPAEPGLDKMKLGNPGPATSNPPTDVPPGFAIFPLAHLTPAEQQAINAQRALYQQAYDLARKAADEKFIRDWVI